MAATEYKRLLLIPLAPWHTKPVSLAAPKGMEEHIKAMQNCVLGLQDGKWVATAIREAHRLVLGKILSTCNTQVTIGTATLRVTGNFWKMTWAGLKCVPA